MKKIKIARIVTAPIVFVHILNLLDAIYKNQKYELHIVCGDGDFLAELKQRYTDAFFHHIEIPREINLLQDLKALLNLMNLFIRFGFDIVHSHTPKAGLLTAIAGFLTMRKVRLHTFTGQVWVTSTGFKKNLLKFLDKLIVKGNTLSYVDSFGQKEFLIQSKIGRDEDFKVLHKGSFGGINPSRFDPTRLQDEILKLKKSIFPSFDGVVLIYLGRLNIEKGLIELHQVFNSLKKKHKLKLLLVGPLDSMGIIEFRDLIDSFKRDRDVVHIPFTSTPELYLGVGDIFCFPSYREGFGTVALEASSMKLPVVASDIYGLSDAVENKVTGLLFKPQSVEDFKEKLEMLLNDIQFRKRLGESGRERVVKDFSETILTSKMMDEYFKLEEYLK